jgi:hypothetical protein
MNDKPRIFISYSHDSDEHKRNVRELADKLCSHGIQCILDQYEESPGEGWITWMEKQVTNSTYVLVVCSQGYLDRFNSDVSDSGKGTKWESGIITQELYDSGAKNRKFIPIILKEEEKKYILRILRPYTYYNVGSEERLLRLCRRVSVQPSASEGLRANVIKFPSLKAKTDDSRGFLNGGEVRVSQSIAGANNVQVGVVSGNLKISTPKKPAIVVLPSSGSIGTNSLLKKAIEDRFNRLGEEREKRFGKSAYGVMYNTFKRDFGIQKNKKWTEIWDWPEATADQIISYLDLKYANTMSGRIKGAVERGASIPAKGHLFSRERELLAQLDLEISSPEVKEALLTYFGVDSHTKLDRVKHWHWVIYLEKLVREKIGE